MLLKLKGIEIDVPEGISVEVSDDGLKIKLSVTAPVEVIRVVEVPGPITETIRIVEVKEDKPLFPVTPWVPINPPFQHPWDTNHPIPATPWNPDTYRTSTGTGVPSPLTTNGK